MDPSLAPYDNTIHEALGVRAVELDPDRVVFELDVTPRVHQPFGLLHGGASAVIAESAASMGAWLNCDQQNEYTVGVDLNITHLRARSEGTVRATATPIRKGKTVQVWAIDIDDQDGERVAVARCTLAVRPLGRR